MRWLTVFYLLSVWSLSPVYELVFFMEVLYSSLMEGGWTGSQFFFESFLSVNLSMLSFLLTLFVFMSEIVGNIFSLCKVVMLFSVIFFSCLSLLLMFMMFELVMMPVLIMIVIYGDSPEKVGASYYAIAYTSSFSLPFLYVVVSMENFPDYHYMSPVLLLCATGLFLVKSPLFMLHFWLPKAHVEAPTSCSMLLAGLLLKVGVYGVMKIVVLSKCLFIPASLLAAGGVLFGGFLASMSSESKVLTAYSSVTHINLGLYGVNVGSGFLLESSQVLCLGHGYVSTLMFFFVGEMYHQGGSRVLHYMVSVLKVSGFIMVLITLVYLGNAGVPPTLPFWSELTSVSGLFNHCCGSLTFMLGYFMVAFYYSVYMLMHTAKPGGVSPLKSTSGFLLLLGVIATSNILII